MAVCTVQNCFDDVRAYLGDTGVVGGEVFTNNFLLGTSASGVAGSGSLFGEPYRSLYSKLTGGSKIVEPTVVIVIPANTTVVIPTTYNIVDFGAPEMLEERTAPTGIPIASTDTGTPITVTTSSPHGLGPNGSMTEGVVSAVAGTAAPWGNWFATITNATQFTLNGSASDGLAGTGGAFYPENDMSYTEVFNSDFVSALDGFPQETLGNYCWQNGRLLFRGATGNIELRISYYASGSAPTNPNYVIWIDDCRDFLSTATASNAARAKGWRSVAEDLRNKAYGDPSHPEETSLIDLFFARQVLADQRGPARRQRPFRDRRYKWGAYLLG